MQTPTPPSLSCDRSTSPPDTAPVSTDSRPISLDPLSLSALISSRLCHDLINPVGALSAGLEIFAEEGDPGMREEALKLIKTSTEKSIAMLNYARLAFGAGGAYGFDIEVSEVKSAAMGYYEHVKADLIWELDVATLSKPHCKALMSLLIMICDCVPRRESRVRVFGGREMIRIEAEGPKATIKETLQAALRGNCEGIEPKMAPAFLAQLLISEAGGEIDFTADSPGRVTFTLFWPQCRDKQTATGGSLRPRDIFATASSTRGL